MSARPVVRLMMSLLVMTVILSAPRSWAEFAAWDQTKVTGLARELERSTDALYETFLEQPSPNLGSVQTEPYYRLKEMVRMLRGETRLLVKSLENGDGREQTAWTYEMLMSLTRSARYEAQRVFVAKGVSERATAVRRVLNLLGPYYDPDFQTLVPDANIEPGAGRERS